MAEIKKNDDGTCELTDSFRYSNGVRIFSVCGCKKCNKFEIEVSITPPLKGKQAYVPKIIYLDVKIENGDIKINEELSSSDYPKDVITDIKKTIKDFCLGYEKLSFSE